jgi:hypothetical protein
LETSINKNKEAQVYVDPVVNTFHDTKVYIALKSAFLLEYLWFVPSI